MAWRVFLDYTPRNIKVFFRKIQNLNQVAQAGYDCLTAAQFGVYLEVPI